MGYQRPPQFNPENFSVLRVVLAGVGTGDSAEQDNYGAGVGFAGGPDWECDPTRNYSFCFWHDSHWEAAVKTDGYLGWNEDTKGGTIAYPDWDLFMRGVVLPGETSFFSVGGAAVLFGPIVWAVGSWRFKREQSGGNLAYADGRRPTWQFEVLETVAMSSGGDPDEPCPPKPAWPYGRQPSSFSSGGIIPHRRVIGGYGGGV
jgi:hypothetical protein